MKKLIKIISSMSVMLALSLPAQAHYIWLEPVDGQARLYFGEYGEGVREKTGGRLDTIAMPEAQTNPADGKRSTLLVQRKADYLALQVAGLEPLIAQDVSMKVKDLTKYNIGIVKPMYYARFSTGGAEPASVLGLDIQPLGEGRVRVNLHGKPLAKAKLHIYAPNQWMQEFTTSDAGEVTVSTPWPGLYVLEVVYVESVKGEYQGDAYEGIRHVGTLSLIK
jgi:hypothetical protein